MVMALQQSLLVVFTVVSFYCPLPFTCTGSATANYELKWYFLALHQVSGFIVCVCVCVCVCFFVVLAGFVCVWCMSRACQDVSGLLKGRRSAEWIFSALNVRLDPPIMAVILIESDR